MKIDNFKMNFICFFFDSVIVLPWTFNINLTNLEKEINRKEVELAIINILKI